ncbi:hypothetical protein ACMFMG_001775 [Clarireedia jacksonii]
MSSESIIANKRGRPKKLVASEAEPTTTRQKSTKPPAGKSKGKSVAAKSTVVKSATHGMAGKSNLISAAQARSASATATATANAKITPPTPSSSSPILSQVRELEREKVKASTSASGSHPLPQSTTVSASSSPKTTAKPIPSAASKIPLKSLNQAITSQLTMPGGARPTGSQQQKPLPSNYQSVARRVTMTIVALPIVIVTSWILWDRVVLGAEKKSLIRDPPPPTPVSGPDMHR